MTKPRANEPEGFAEFWSIWLPISRRNDGRGLARAAFRKHVEAGAAPQDIIDGARWYVRNLSDKDKPYVPLSQTWLNRGTYEDLCEKEREHRARQAERAAATTQSKVIGFAPRLGQTAFLRAYNHIIKSGASDRIEEALIKR